MVSYLRKAPGEEILIVINLSGTPFRGTVEAGSGAWSQVEVPAASSAEPQQAAALPAVSLDAYRFRIFEHKQ